MLQSNESYTRMQVPMHRFMYAYAIAITAMQKLRMRMANMLPFITCFMIDSFTVKKSIPQAASNSFIHQLANVKDEMCNTG
jgi:hypothetical protein